MRQSSPAFKGKTVWVTGASSGIGQALAIEFAKQGARVVVSARRTEALEQTRARCVELGGEAAVVPLDLADEASHAEAARRAAEPFGPVDILVHSGGITSRGLASETLMEVDHRVMQVNFFGTISVTRQVLPSMRERGSGHIVVITSVTGKIGTQYRSAYAASKHALHGWFDSLRLEVDREGVAVTLVCPGFIATDLTLHALTPDGTPLNQMNEAQQNGMPSDVFARKLLPGIAARRHEIVIGGKETVTIPIKRFFPRLLHEILLRSKVT